MIHNIIINMYNKLSNNNKQIKIFKIKGFTMSEVIVALSVLGIIAVLTIPSVLNSQGENKNKLKLRKAMSVYAVAYNNILMENNLLTENKFIEWRKNDIKKGYSGHRSNFKIINESTSYPNCRFKTSDEIWWDICGENDSNINNPIVIIDEKYKDKSRAKLEALSKIDEEDNKIVHVYTLVGRRDNETGLLKINDIQYENNLANNIANRQYLEKIYSYLNDRELNIIDD